MSPNLEKIALCRDDVKDWFFGALTLPYTGLLMSGRFVLVDVREGRIWQLIRSANGCENSQDYKQRYKSAGN
jgi:hypothetical protein